LIPLSRGHESRDRLLTQGYRIEWHEYPMPHSVCAEEIADLSAWLREVLRSA
jgi:phospholipase/carboxylesterase